MSNRVRNVGAAVILFVAAAHAAATDSRAEVEAKYGVSCAKHKTYSYEDCIQRILSIGEASDAAAARAIESPQPAYNSVEAELSEKYGERCSVIAPRYTPDYGRCVLDQADKAADRNQAADAADARNMAAKRMALLRYLQSQQVAPYQAKPYQMPTPPPTTNCTTQYIGNQAFTRCY